MDHTSLYKFVLSLQNGNDTEKFQILKDAVLHYCFEQDRLHTDYLSTLALIPLYQILWYLSASDLARLSLTCKDLRHVCEDDVFWKKRAKAQVLACGFANSGFWGDGDLSQGPWQSGKNTIYTVDDGEKTMCDMNYFIERCLSVCHHLTWKWWYSNLRMALYGSDKADELTFMKVNKELSYALLDIDNTTTESERETLTTKDPNLINWLEFYREKYIRRLKDMQVSKRSQKIFTKKNIQFRFKVDFLEFDYLLCAQIGRWVMLVKEEHISQENYISHYHQYTTEQTVIVKKLTGYLIGIGFTWEGRGLVFSSYAKFIANFGKGKIKFDDGFEVDTEWLGKYKLDKYAGNIVLLDSAQDATFKINHPLVLKTQQCIVDFKCYPQQFFEEDQGYYCVSCHRARCYLREKKRKSELKPHMNYLWVYADSLISCACETKREKCKLRDAESIFEPVPFIAQGLHD